MGRGVWFFSADLERADISPGRTRCVGPLPSRESVGPLRILAKVINRSSQRGLSPKRLATSLGLDGRMFKEGALLEGISLFAAEQGLSCGEQSARTLRSLGLRLHQVHLAATDESAEEDEQVKETEAERLVDAEGAARLIERLIIGAACAICRGRWLTLLSEVTICWHRGRERRLLILENGLVRAACTLAHGEVCPIPPGHGRSRQERLQTFDRATYDRLRVLTTELRRLITQARHVEVHLGPGRMLGPSRLALVFNYI